MADLKYLPEVNGVDMPLPADTTPVVLGVRFGDGYRQECQDGVAAETAGVLPVAWKNLSTPAKLIIDNFLEERGGVGRIAYAIPGSGETRAYICRQWQVSERAFNVWDITATFIRTPDTDGVL